MAFIGIKVTTDIFIHMEDWCQRKTINQATNSKVHTVFGKTDILCVAFFKIVQMWPVLVLFISNVKAYI